MTGEKTWGVTVLQAAAEMDAGPIWATREFPLGETPITKSSLYRNQVTEAAVAACWRPSPSFSRGQFQPEPLDYGKADVRGRLRPTMRQSGPRHRLDPRLDRHDHAKDRRRRQRARRAGRSVRRTPTSCSEPIAEDRLKGAPGRLLAQRDGAICRATVDGAVWITHLKAKDHGPSAGIKLPAVHALGLRAARTSNLRAAVRHLGRVSHVPRNPLRRAGQASGISTSISTTAR